MDKLDVTKTVGGREKTRIYTERLNFLFRFAELDPWKLNGATWEPFLDELHFAMYGAARKREGAKVTWAYGNFSRTATREAIGKAQRALSRFIATGKAKLLKQTIELRLHDEKSEFAGEYFYNFASEDFSTSVILEFAHLLEVCELRQTDFLRCAQCGVTFVPRRKPHKDTPNYCSFKCANGAAVRKYRERKEEEQKKAAKKKKTRKVSVKG